MNEYIVGIDIGTSKVCAAVGKLEKQGDMQIVGITSVFCNGLKKGVVVDIDSTSESIKSCIEQLERMADIEIDNAFISLTGGITELISSKGVVAVSSEDREIKANDIDRVLNAAKIISIPSDKEIVGIVPKQYIIDGYDNIKDPLGMSGLRLEVDAQVIVAQSTVVNNLFKSLNKASIKVNGLVLQPLALSHVVLKKEELNLGTALVDIGAETINLYIYKGGSLCYTNMLPFGGSTITNDISLCLKIPYTEAEKLKIKYGTIEKPVREYNEKIKVNAGYNDYVYVDYETLSEIIEARVEEFLYLIDKQLKESNLHESISGIVLVGGGISLFRGITELGKSVLNKPIRIGTPNYVGAASPIYATAIGVIKDVMVSVKSSSITEEKKEKIVVKKSAKNSVKYNENEDEKSFISKIKGFFVDFF